MAVSVDGRHGKSKKGFDLRPELLKVAYLQTHVFAKFSRICAKVGMLNVKQERHVQFS